MYSAKCKACDRPVECVAEVENGDLCITCYIVAMSLIPKEIRNENYALDTLSFIIEELEEDEGEI